MLPLADMPYVVRMLQRQPLGSRSPPLSPGLTGLGALALAARLAKRMHTWPPAVDAACEVGVSLRELRQVSWKKHWEEFLTPDTRVRRTFCSYNMETCSFLGATSNPQGPGMCTPSRLIS